MTISRRKLLGWSIPTSLFTFGVAQAIDHPPSSKYKKKHVLVKDVIALRNLKPDFDGQIASLEMYGDGYYRGGSQVYFDKKNDKEDNGITTFVTSSGARWERLPMAEIPLEWAGFNGDDATEPLQNIINYIVSLAVKNKSFSALPSISINGGKYTLSSSIHTAPFIRMVSNGIVTFKFTSITNGGLFCNNDWHGLVNNDFSFAPSSGCYFIDGDGGQFIFIGPGEQSAKYAGLTIGNKDVNSLPVREAMTRNTLFSGFLAGHRWLSINTYLCTHYDTRLEKNKHGILVDDTSAKNSGERLSYYNLTCGDTVENHIFHNCSGMDFYFFGGSFDFSNGRVLRFGASGAYSDVKFFGAHIEYWNDMLIKQDKHITGAGTNRVFFDKCKIIPRHKNGVNSIRPIFKSYSPLYVSLQECNLSFESIYSGEYGSLIDFDDIDSNKLITLSVRNNGASREFLTSYFDVINKPVEMQRFIRRRERGEGESSFTDDGYGYKSKFRFEKNKNTTIDISNDLVINLEVINKYEAVSVFYDKYLTGLVSDTVYGLCSIRTSGMIGRMLVLMVVEYFDENKNKVASELGDFFDFSEVLNAAKEKTNTDINFSVTPTFFSKISHGYSYYQVGMRFYGFSGGVKIKLPVWWFGS